MPRIALVTYAAAPALTSDDELLDDALRARGASTSAVPWDDPEADWSAYDLVVLRSSWDYFLRADEFDRWVGVLEARDVRLVNPYAVVRWNGDKRYLMELASRGVDIVPAEFVRAPGAEESRETLREILVRTGWNQAVVKPVVSGGGHETWRTSLAGAASDESRFRELCMILPAGVMVQPFVPQVVTDGEWSLVFIAGRYSHAAIKRAREGEFRVQSVHGGTYSPASAPSGLIADAERVIAAAAACTGVATADLTYARVDGVAIHDGDGARLLLMELECLEPSLFFLQAPDAAQRMADTLMQLALAPVSGSRYLR